MRPHVWVGGFARHVQKCATCGDLRGRPPLWMRLLRRTPCLSCLGVGWYLSCGLEDCCLGIPAGDRAPCGPCAGRGWVRAGVHA